MNPGQESVIAQIEAQAKGGETSKEKAAKLIARQGLEGAGIKPHTLPVTKNTGRSVNTRIERKL